MNVQNCKYIIDYRIYRTIAELNVGIGIYRYSRYDEMSF